MGSRERIVDSRISILTSAAVALSVTTVGCNVVTGYDDMDFVGVGAVSCQTEWKPAAELPEGRSACADAVTANGHAFLAGGLGDNGPDGKVFAARLEEGVDPTWKSAAILPSPRYYAAAAAVGDRLYVLGGIGFTATSDELLTEVVSATVGPSGDVGPWRTESALPEGVGDFRAVAVGSYLFAMGGVTDFEQPPSAHVRRATIGDDGVLGEWQAADDLPEGLWAFSATATASEIYVVGGGSYSGVSDLVLRGTVDADGEIAWQQGGLLPEALFSHGAALVGDRLCTFGGESESGVSKAVRCAAVGAPMDEATWKDLPELPETRVEATAVIQGKRALVVGGSLNIYEAPASTVFAATFCE